jgi:Rrf2 family transcriptional regulator, iron-sulfur cluster assembly transcription factor
MRLTRGADYGLRGMIHLAQLPKGGVALVQEVAEQENVPESYLAKIFQDLSRSGLMVSHRGAKGGFSLARDPAQITLKQMIEAIEGPIFLLPCLDPRERCEKEQGCALYEAVAQAQHLLLDQLDRTSLQSLADRTVELSREKGAARESALA